MKKKLFIAIILVFTCVSLYGQEQEYRWRVADKQMPHPVWGAQVIYDQNSGSKKIYILGGYSDSLQEAVDWIQQYDVANDSWEIVGHMNQPRHLFVADIWDSCVVYFGGADDTSANKNDLESWKFKPTFSTPTIVGNDVNFGRTFSTGQIKGDSLYIIGGNPTSANINLPYIAEYNLKSKTFGLKNNYPNGDIPEQHMTMVIGDNIYVFGGVFNGVKKWIRKFNIPTKTYIQLNQTLPNVRADGAAVFNSISNKGYIIGGRNETDAALSTVEEVTFISDTTLQFTSNFPPLTYERTNLMAVNYGPYVAVFGGKNKENKVVPYVEILEKSETNTSTEKNTPKDFYLSQNYPNPFNPNTTISYQIPSEGFVTLKVFDILGREVAVLVNGEKAPGNYNTNLNLAQFSSAQASGIYYYRITFTDAANKQGHIFSETKKMVLLK